MPSPAHRARRTRTAVRTAPPRVPSSLREVVEATLRDWIGKLIPLPRPRRSPGRPPVIPASLLWTAILVCVVRGFSSQLELWRLLTQWGLWHYPKVDVTDMAIYKRLERTSPTAMQQFFEQVSTLIREHQDQYEGRSALSLAPFATEILALDQTVLDPVLKKLKILRELPTGHRGLLPGVLTCLFDLRRQQWSTVAFSPDALQNEKPGAVSMLSGVPPGSLILFDLGYFSFPWFDHLAHEGYWFVSRFRKRASFVESHLLYSGGNAKVQVRDALGYLGAHAADRAAYPVRLVEITVSTTAGKRVYRYLTNVTDPRKLQAWQVVALYRYRWDIEKAFDLIKTHLGLHLLWSAHQNVVLHQVFATLLLAQVVLALRAEIAHLADADVREVSLVLMLKTLPRLAADGHDPVALFVERGRQAGCIRPFRPRDYGIPRAPLSDYLMPERLPPRRKARYNRAKENPDHARLQQRLNALPADTV